MIYPNCWNDFRPIIAIEYYSSNSWFNFVPTIAGTDQYAKFSNNCCWYDCVPINCDWVCAICLIPWYDFSPIMAGVVILPLAGTISYRLSLVYSITGVFYHWRILLPGTISYQLSLNLGSRAFIVMFLQVRRCARAPCSSRVHNLLRSYPCHLPSLLFRLHNTNT